MKKFLNISKKIGMILMMMLVFSSITVAEWLINNSIYNKEQVHILLIEAHPTCKPKHVIESKTKISRTGIYKVPNEKAHFLLCSEFGTKIEFNLNCEIKKWNLTNSLNFEFCW